MPLTLSQGTEDSFLFALPFAFPSTLKCAFIMTPMELFGYKMSNRGKWIDNPAGDI